jgi:type IV secretory pathway VirD2 relaxase
VAQEYLDMMDIRNTQFIIARHFDKNHPHCHILYNRVDNDGRTISDSNIRRRNVAACKKLNQKYGFILGKKGDRRHQNPDKLKGKALAKYQMCAKVLAARQQSRSWNEFRSNLENVGIKIYR